MAWRFSGRARTDPHNPKAFAVCDRCGIWYNHVDLQWQHDFRGNKLVNIRLLVCQRCLDKPFELNRPLKLPPDPPPVMDARPEQFYVDEAGSAGTPESNVPAEFWDEPNTYWDDGVTTWDEP